jgi:NADPH-dependent curcumin reductase CurA
VSGAGANRQVRLAARPRGLPGEEVWEHRSEPVPEPGEGQALVAISHISLDPAMRGWMNDARSYVPPVGLGEVMRAGGAGRVIASRDRKLPEGTYVTGIFGVQEYAVCDARSAVVVDPQRAPLERWLGALGMTGLTAYFGMLEVGRPEPGDTVLVSGAAGAVGSVAGQIARLCGCRVVGIAGGERKCEWLTGELGFHAAIDYKAEDVRRALAAAAPDGIDVYFDNVGGEILEIALAALRLHARVVICGAISQYNESEVRGPANYLSLLVNRASMTGMIVFDWAERYAEGRKRLLGWLESGELKAREHVIHGSVDDFPEALRALFDGVNVGKLVLALDRDGPSQRSVA